ncbi:hypothetical protein ZWY2020_053723 [Hordeum vulgare]|nr:hypothetical protein ZWY2020_053723 [Hordeum vulgare]
MAGIGPSTFEEEGDGEAEHDDGEQRQQDGRDEPLPPEPPSEGAAMALPAGVLGLGRTRAGVPGTWAAPARSASQAAGAAPTAWGRRAAPGPAARWRTGRARRAGAAASSRCRQHAPAVPRLVFLACPVRM